MKLQKIPLESGIHPLGYFDNKVFSIAPSSSLKAERDCSSWPLFTLSHHLVIWYCAQKVYPGQHFRKYAVLGDDVCIMDANVADAYQQTLDRLGVEISVSKSLVSHSGAAEFAKRFRVKNITFDLSPVSIRNLLNSHHLPGTVSLLNTYGIKLFSTLARLHFSFMPLSGKLLQFSNKWKKSSVSFKRRNASTDSLNLKLALRPVPYPVHSAILPIQLPLSTLGKGLPE